MSQPTYVYALLAVFFAHWVGDFALQNRWMADNKHAVFKSKVGAQALLSHVTLVSLALLTAALFVRITQGGDYWAPALLFAFLNGFFHFVTDSVTSNVTGFFWRRNTEEVKMFSEDPTDPEPVGKAFKIGDLHPFFTTIGFDQFLHAAVYILTIPVLLR